MIEALNNIATMLAVRLLMNVTIPEFATAVRGHTDPEALSENLRDKSDHLVIQKARDLAEARDFETARTVIGRIISDERASTTAKFNALLQSEEIEVSAVIWGGAPQELWGRVVLDAGIALQKLTRKGPAAFKLYALIARLAGEFHALAIKDLVEAHAFGFGQIRRKSDLVRPGLRVASNQHTTKAEEQHREYQQDTRLLPFRQAPFREP
jgi:hypothetical protein